MPPGLPLTGAAGRKSRSGLAGLAARRPGTVGVITWVASIAAGSAAMLLANFGAPAWVFALLLAWLATVGLPTTATVLAVASVERWPWVGVLPLGAALAVMAGLALAAQLAACRLIASLLRRGGESSGASP